MFDKPKTTEALVATSPVSADIVIHTMPREFYGKEASIQEERGPALPEKRVVPPPVVVPISMQPKRKRSKWGVLVTLLVALLVIGGVAYGAYRMVTVANENAKHAQEEVERLKAEDAAKAKAQNAADAAQKKRDEDAAAAAALPVPGTDTDSDGLTDVEELLYGTNFRDPDSDDDTFLDGNEVFHRYHPMGGAPLTLLDTGAVKVFSDAAYPYTIYYPSTWSAALTRDNLGVLFQSSRQASIGVTWSQKDITQSLSDYLVGKITDAERSKMKEIMTKEGYDGLTSADDRTAYLNLGSAVATLSYSLGGRAQIEYLQTFQMMVNSIILVSP